MKTIREIALDYLIEWGPATVSEIAYKSGGVNENNVRAALQRLERDGDVVRASFTTVRGVNPQARGGRAILWAIPGDVEEQHP